MIFLLSFVLLIYPLRKHRTVFLFGGFREYDNTDCGPISHYSIGGIEKRGERVDGDIERVGRAARMGRKVVEALDFEPEKKR